MAMSFLYFNLSYNFSYFTFFNNFGMSIFWVNNQKLTKK